MEVRIKFRKMRQWRLTISIFRIKGLMFSIKLGNKNKVGLWVINWASGSLGRIVVLVIWEVDCMVVIYYWTLKIIQWFPLKKIETPIL